MELVLQSIGVLFPLRSSLIVSEINSARRKKRFVPVNPRGNSAFWANAHRCSAKGQITNNRTAFQSPAFLLFGYEVTLGEADTDVI